MLDATKSQLEAAPTKMMFPCVGAPSLARLIPPAKPGDLLEAAPTKLLRRNEVGTDSLISPPMKSSGARPEERALHFSYLNHISFGNSIITLESHSFVKKE